MTAPVPTVLKTQVAKGVAERGALTLPRWRQNFTGVLLIVGLEEGLLWYAHEHCFRVCKRLSLCPPQAYRQNRQSSFLRHYQVAATEGGEDAFGGQGIKSAVTIIPPIRCRVSVYTDSILLKFLFTVGEADRHLIIAVYSSVVKMPHSSITVLSVISCSKSVSNLNVCKR